MPDRLPLHPLPEPERAKRLAEMGLGLDRLPLNLTPAERKAAAMETSPTGTPLIPATGLALKIATLIVALAAVVAVSDFFPATGMDERIAGGVVAIGALLGIASPGVRRAPQP